MRVYRAPAMSLGSLLGAAGGSYLATSGLRILCARCWPQSWQRRRSDSDRREHI